MQEIFIFVDPQVRSIGLLTIALTGFCNNASRKDHQDEGIEKSNRSFWRRHFTGL